MENNIINTIFVDNKEYDINSKYWNGLEVDEKQDTLIIKTTDGDTISILGSGDITLVRDVIEITYEDIVNLCENSQLVPGQQYRITDYITTVREFVLDDTITTAHYLSGEHQFDIIVTAVSENEINEIAKAAIHEDDTYFANCNLNKWELKYTIYNDTSKYSWANATNGKGVIYYMKDEYNNECPYDFKNIRYMHLLDESTIEYHYTFGGVNDDTVAENITCSNNIIKSCIRDGSMLIEDSFNYVEEGSQILNFILFGTDCINNKFDYNCFNDTFGIGCVNNTFEMYCQHNKFGDNCKDNCFGASCFMNTFGDNNMFNSFTSSCLSNNFGNECSANTFGNDCSSNTFGNDCSSNTFGNDCSSNTFGNDCYNNTFGDSCYNITFSTISGDAKCYFKNLNFENGCEHMTIIEDTHIGELLVSYAQNYVFMNSASGVYNGVQTYTVKRGNTYSTKVAKTSDGTIRTYCEEDIQGIQTSITYSDLVTLKTESKLIPGMQYRITDFVTKTATMTNVMSAEHQFDVIVTAVSENAFNEDAKATLHEDDTYFANCNIDSWDLKYCIDNDTARFEWADITNGKGVIYYMKDNGGNEACYDFKNIMFKNPLNTDDDTWYYTFTNTDGSDFSLSVGSCYENKISGYYIGVQLILNNIIFNCFGGRRSSIYNNVLGHNCYNNVFSYNCYNNTFGHNCYNNTFGYSFVDNIFGRDCFGNIFGYRCYNNNFSYSCYNNTFGDNCYSNIFSHFCYNNKFGYGFISNTLGYNCNGNNFGTSCSSNKFGDSCYSNIFGNGCCSNIFGNGCHSNTFGEICSDNIFELACYSNTFGNNCYSNTFGNECIDNTFGEECYSNTFGQDFNGNTLVSNCWRNTFGNSCYRNSLEDGCHDNNFGKICDDNIIGLGCAFNIFGNSCYENNFGDYCHNNAFGNQCYSNNFGNSCTNNNFGDDCYENTFGIYCRYNTFGNDCFSITFSTIRGDKNCYFKNISFENNCSYMTIIEDISYDTVQLYVQNYVFMNSMSGLSDRIQKHTVKRGLMYNTTVERDSYGQIKEYCKADTRNAYDIVNVDTQGAARYSIGIRPNTMYVIPELQELTIAYVDIPENVAKEYVFQFVSGSTATTLIMPLSTLWANGITPLIKPHTIYQISVLNNLATLLEFPMP